jgi:hypothetical protein
LEQERTKSLGLFCDRIQENLIDIAFMLAPEVEDLVRVNRIQYNDMIIERKSLNDQYVFEVN